MNAFIASIPKRYYTTSRKKINVFFPRFARTAKPEGEEFDTRRDSGYHRGREKSGKREAAA